MAKRDVSFVLVSHQAKPNAERKGRHTVRGTSALVDDVDVALRLEAPDGPRAVARVLHFDKVRTCETPEPIALTMDFNFATFERVEGRVEVDGPKVARERAKAEAKAAEQRKAEEAVGLLLRKSPDGLTVLDIHKLTGRHRDWVADVLDGFHAHGWVEPAETTRKDASGRSQRVNVWRWVTREVGS